MNRLLNRRTLAPLAYILTFSLVYSVVLENVNWLDSMRSGNQLFAWGEHYFLFLITVVVASFFSALLAGEMLETTRPTINLICVLVVQGYLFFTLGDFLTSNKFTVLMASVLSIGATLIGSVANLYQFADDKKKILGIDPIHWCWILVPISFSPSYFWGVNFVHSLLRLASLWWSSEDFLIRIASLITIIPVISWALVAYAIYCVLANKICEDKSTTYRFISVVLIYAVGYGLAFLIQSACYWVIDKFLL